MNETRQSLLLRAQTGETDAWKDLTDLYRPLILGWLNRQGVPARDLEDLSQEVLLSVFKHLPAFQHSGNRGAFRSWLRTIVCSRTADYWRANDAGTQASGGSGTEVAEELGLSVAAVYVAKSRVLARIRQEAEGLID